MRVLDLWRKPQAVELQQPIVEAQNQLSATLAGCGVKKSFMPHVTDNQTGADGLRNAILRVMREKPDCGLTCEEITLAVRKANKNFAVDWRYPQQTYADNLSDVLIPSGEVVVVKRRVIYNDKGEVVEDQDPKRNCPDAIAMRKQLRAWDKLNGYKVRGLIVKQCRCLYFPVPVEKIAEMKAKWEATQAAKAARKAARKAAVKV